MGAAFLRDAEWLGPQRARGYLWLLAALNVATLLWLLLTARGGVDRNGFLLGTDFLSFWTAGRMLHAGLPVYDAAAHIAAQQRYFAAPDSYTAFFYPPPFLLLCYPLGALGYFPALGAWLALTGAAYLAAACAWLGQLANRPSLLVLAAAFPPVLITLTHGQTSFLVAALLGLGALWVAPRPVLAGICFGLATIKPQLGVLVPIVLAVTGEWRVMAVAAAAALVLAGVTTMAFGLAVWGHWLAVSGQAQAALEAGAVGFAKMMSPFAGARLIGAPVAVAYVVQALAALAVVAALAWAGWGRRYGPGLGAAMLAGAPLVTPFVLDYDLVVLAFPLIWLAATGYGPWGRIAVLAGFAGAAFARPLGVAVAVPIMPVIIAGLFAVVVVRARKRDEA